MTWHSLDISSIPFQTPYASWSCLLTLWGKLRKTGYARTSITGRRGPGLNMHMYAQCWASNTIPTSRAMEQPCSMAQPWRMTVVWPLPMYPASFTTPSPSCFLCVQSNWLQLPRFTMLCVTSMPLLFVSVWNALPTSLHLKAYSFFRTICKHHLL